MTNTLQAQIRRIRGRAWLVVAVTAISVGGALAAVMTADTTYTGKATLTIDSEARLPEQDVAIARSYADTLNYAPYQEKLREAAGLPEDVTFTAGTAASGPMVIVEATTNDEASASASASVIAEAFRDDFNASWRAGRDNAIAELMAKWNEELLALGDLPPEGGETALRTVAVNALRDRIGQLESDTTDQVQILQSDAGVTENSPSQVRTIGLALVGGFLLGCVLALVIAAVENRVTTADDVRELVGLDTLAEVPRGGSAAAESVRQKRFRQLANVVAPPAPPSTAAGKHESNTLWRMLKNAAHPASASSRSTVPAVLAVVAPVATDGTTQVAAALAEQRAVRGDRTLLIRADFHHTRQDERQPGEATDAIPGVADFLSRHGVADIDHLVRAGITSRLRVMEPGHYSGDPYALFTRDRLDALVQATRGTADLVVVEAPPINEVAEGQVICASVDGVILVFERAVTRGPDAVRACELLDQVDATVLGAVVVESRTAKAPSSRRRVPRWLVPWRHAEPTAVDEVLSTGEPDAPPTDMRDELRATVPGAAPASAGNGAKPTVPDAVPASAGNGAKPTVPDAVPASAGNGARPTVPDTTPKSEGNGSRASEPNGIPDATQPIDHPEMALSEQVSSNSPEPNHA
ncbi:hypothetical protein P3H15_01555 [Rhodococcus sp. T2V]|uniref:hypothetical protein n=1 Tax=Rhodococcus sp. T2V TaxID=3034164 RepID=UPI0023E177D3|nr:hypothetical protein [Rhodococcus sp. T2V]MDF3303692.1 hypothetical protein [Rhodococcus sp. T2V]